MWLILLMRKYNNIYRNCARTREKFYNLIPHENTQNS